MMIKEFDEVSGESVRTLHYYDEIGLLTPAFVTKQQVAAVMMKTFFF